MSVYRRTYTAAGVSRVARRFTVQFADHARTIRRLPAYPDKAASQEMERKLVRVVSRRAAGEELSPELSRWIDTLPAEARGRLARWGVIDLRRLATAAGLEFHATAYEQALADAGRVESHARLAGQRIRKLVAVAGFATTAEVTAERVQRALARLREGTSEVLGRGGERERAELPGAVEPGPKPRGIGQQTSNHVLAAFKAFLRWMIANGRAADTAELQAVLQLRRQTVTEKRHDRRALSLEELHRLIEAAGAPASPVRMHLAGTERALLYRLAAETGLRAGELRQLRRCDFSFTQEAPSVRVSAAYAKNRKAATLPLRPETAEVLAATLEGKMPAATALRVPPRQHVAKMLKADLEAARTAWLADAPTPQDRADREGSDFLRYRDAENRVADFHALRHTFISNLAAANVHPKIAQQLARHGTIALTLDRYTHADADGMARAVAALPPTERPELPKRQSATGTDGRAAVTGGRGDAGPHPMTLHKPGSGPGSDAPEVAPFQVGRTVTNGHQSGVSGAPATADDGALNPSELREITGFIERRGGDSAAAESQPLHRQNIRRVSLGSP